ncbi:MAG: hypothetical protein VZR02_02100 [Lachnospiraceae bacterium]|nr:hypothetical protein [Lachnospiraceae bacterium]
MKSIAKRIAAVALAGIMGGSLLTGCGSKSNAIDGSKTVVTVNKEEVPLGVLSFYAKFEQAQIYTYYGSMLGTTGMFDQTMEASSADSGEEAKTYGQSLRDTCLTDIEKMVVMRQKADDYDITLTDDEKDEIDKAAQAYIDNNSEEDRKKIGARKEDVVELMTLETYQSKMLDPIAKDVDTNVTDEEAQQTSVTYVSISTEDTSSSSEATSEATESTSGEDFKLQAEANAQSILTAVQNASDPATADMDALAKAVDSSYSATTGHYTTSDTTDGTVDSKVVEAVKDLKDGQVADQVITGSDGKTLYVARLDKVNDEDETETKKASIVRQRKQDEYDKVTDEWVKAATIDVDNDVLNTLTITDADPVSLKMPASSDTTSTTEATSDVTSTAEAASTAS